MFTSIPKPAEKLSTVKVSVPSGFSLEEPEKPEQKRAPRRPLRVGDYLMDEVAATA